MRINLNNVFCCYWMPVLRRDIAVLWESFCLGIMCLWMGGGFKALLVSRLWVFVGCALAQRERGVTVVASFN